MTRKPQLLRSILAATPELAALHGRLADPDFPTPDELLEAERILALDPESLQRELDLKAARDGR